jgi:hypothetical protein
MQPEAKQLVLAILTRSDELEVSVGKTKLLKLLYLADIEHFRESRETLTGIQWIFYLYGPWSPDFDPLLEQLEAEGVIARAAFVASGLEGQQITVKERVNLSKVIKPAAEYFRTKHLLDTWLPRGTPDLIDYVYFETEPMSGAVKQQNLDFTKVNKEAPAPYRRSTGTGTPQQKGALRAKLAERARKIQAQIQSNRRKVAVVYDDNFAQALTILNADGAE